MRNYRDLQVWSKARHLTVELYRVSRGFPREETYGLTSQLRRAAVRKMLASFLASVEKQIDLNAKTAKV